MRQGYRYQLDQQTCGDSHALRTEFVGISASNAWLKPATGPAP